MDGFNLVEFSWSGKPEKSAPYRVRQSVRHRSLLVAGGNLLARQCDVHDPGERELSGSSRSYSGRYRDQLNREPDRQSAVYQSGVGMRFASGKQDGYHHDDASTKASRRAISLHERFPVERRQLHNAEGSVRWRVAGRSLGNTTRRRSAIRAGFGARSTLSIRFATARNGRQTLFRPKRPS